MPVTFTLYPRHYNTSGHAITGSRGKAYASYFAWAAYTLVRANPSGLSYIGAGYDDRSTLFH
jgi:hypothetical protein